MKPVVQINDTMRKWTYLILGNIFFALALDLFFIQNQIAAGGFAGIATVIGYFVPIGIGTLVFLMNIPFIIIAAFIKGKQYTFKTLIASIIYSGFVELFSVLPNATDDLLLAVLFGGVLCALGSVCTIRAEASAGGTDLVARILIHYFPTFSLGKLYMAVDGFSVIFAAVAFQNLELGLYAAVAVFIYSTSVDMMVAGYKKASICYIMSAHKTEEIYSVLSKTIRRSATCQKGVGMYSQEERKILFITVKPREVYALKMIVMDIDPNAFLVVAPANEVQGGGFKMEKSS